MTNLRSSGTSAKALWGFPNLPPSDHLPALKSSSDIIWGLWSLASPNNLRAIKYVFSTPITNDETVVIIKEVLQDNCLQLDELMEWTRREFAADEPEYHNLLRKLYFSLRFFFFLCICCYVMTMMGALTSTVPIGSPSGPAIGYFLAQHKRQLGSKCLSKINVFKADTNVALAICLLFTIEDKVGGLRADTGSDAKAMFVKRDNGGKNLVRQHIVWVKL
ncbi:uncharacterized protein ALTATR162_LOCUS3000 [Alternaria atra]|uniref:Uncharacterized protein n=1 Tax=Alternaria atra TaxID=119953 RepID=A0A8J2MXU1_9PLEO|nr:uncharacterized protein ALTATR162_LOCUS3000 [Alternaria atra]CAG5153011.1 unnamed protein product [Alternaria atra]